jgi:Na+-transporting methylmalonyl-CoA/oxaloacetate decarboxylase gamma subunit
MHLIDRSPGGFIFVANAVLYATVLLETWMLTTHSIAFMFLVMLVIVAVAGFLARFIMDLMGSEEYVTGEAEPAVAPLSPAAAPARAQAPRRAPALAHPAAH